MGQLCQGVPLLLLFDLASLGGLPGSTADTGTGSTHGGTGRWALDPAP